MPGVGETTDRVGEEILPGGGETNECEATYSISSVAAVRARPSSTDGGRLKIPCDGLEDDELETRLVVGAVEGATASVDEEADRTRDV